MNDKSSSGPNNNQGGPKKHHHNKRRHFHKPKSPNENANSNGPQAQGNPTPNKKKHHKFNKGEKPAHINIDRIYEKYLNLLDQHIIARRKYHDLFYRADPNQKIKLEKNFYNSLNDIREFENKMTPETRQLFEKRNNGLANDNVYAQNHTLELEGILEIKNESEIEDPHYLKSQEACDYSNDIEESKGTYEDYLKYKGL